MTDAHRSLHAHSEPEARCYMLTRPCPECGVARLVDDAVTEVSRHIERTVDLAARCAACGAACTLRFRLDPDDAPSELLDVAQWLTLAHRFLAEADAADSPPAARSAKLRAAHCLDEALKFYVTDNDLPPDTAFFGDERRHRARTNPRPFLRTVLLDLRRRLPTPPAP